MKYTVNDLWRFVWRANTAERIITAEKWLREEKHYNMVKAIGGVDLWDDLMKALAFNYREIGRQDKINSMKPQYRAQYQ